MTDPLDPEVVEACAKAVRQGSVFAIGMSQADAEAHVVCCIRAFLAHWRPEVSDGMINAACPLYDDQCDLDGSIGPMIQAALDTLLRDARGGA